jgi:hypothetical protein
MKALAALCLLGALASAESISGKLVDAACVDKSLSGEKKSEPAPTVKNKTAEACAPTGATSVFGLRTANGKVYRLNADGNEKAVAAMQSGVLKNDTGGDVPVTIEGSIQGEAVRVSAINPR